MSKTASPLLATIQRLLTLTPDEAERLSRAIATDSSEGAELRNAVLRLISLTQQAQTNKRTPGVTDLNLWRQSHPRPIKRPVE